MTNIAPGEYKLFAWEGVEPGAWMDPEVLRDQDSLGMKVVLIEGDSRTADVQLIPKP
jgi:hypothetical protein